MTYQYSLLQWIFVFYIYCFLGWCFETVVVSVKQKQFVNRGFLRSPMLPIYGFGATMLLHISLPLYHKLVLLFLSSLISATVFEYIVGAVMEKLFKVRYWDYSTHHFQLNGYICMQSSICWGVMGLILARFIHPPVEYIVSTVSNIWLTIFVLAISFLFVSDVVLSVRAALDFARVLEELNKLKEQGAELQKQLTETAKVKLTNMSYRVEEAKGEWTEKIEEAKDEWNEKMEDTKEQLQKRKEEWQVLFDNKMKNLSKSRIRMLRRNPSASSKRYNDILQQIKERIDSGRHG